MPIPCTLGWTVLSGRRPRRSRLRRSALRSRSPAHRTSTIRTEGVLRGRAFVRRWASRGGSPCAALRVCSPGRHGQVPNSCRERCRRVFAVEGLVRAAQRDFLHGAPFHPPLVPGARSGPVHRLLQGGRFGRGACVLGMRCASASMARRTPSFRDPAGIAASSVLLGKKVAAVPVYPGEEREGVLGAKPGRHTSTPPRA